MMLRYWRNKNSLDFQGSRNNVPALKARWLVCLYSSKGTLIGQDYSGPSGFDGDPK